jgi:hypothetical protein
VTPEHPITRVRIEIERGGFTRYVELHGTADEPVDGAAAIAEDGEFGMVELRLRDRLEPSSDEG